MRYLFFISFLVILASCSDSSPKKEANNSIKKKRGVHIDKPQIPQQIDYAALDSSVREQIKTLDGLYGRTPYYTIVQNKKLFVVLKGKFNPDSAYYLPKFTGRFKYGIAGDDLKFVLTCDYDKIYNPNLTALNCMEIKKEDRIGLFNFMTKEVLEPQFEYISPSSDTPDNNAYGFKEGSWYKIDVENKFKLSKTEFSPLPILKALSFNVKEINENLFYGSYNIDDVNGPSTGLGVVITPSYIEHLKIMPEICEDLLLPDQKDDFGTSDMNIKTDEERSVSDKITSFFVKFYHSGIDGRGYESTDEQVVTYNREKKEFNSSLLSSSYGDYDSFCKVRGYKFVNDTLIEILGNVQTDTSKKRRYDSENSYFYKSVSPDGEIKDLSCHRYYNFTKYFVIDGSYFEGCYVSLMAEQEDDFNIWVSEHLSSDDLALMTNEIYAEYGLKFKTDKWKNYFSQFSWYHPLYDNVDDKLTEIDKRNIAIIANEKELLKGKEEDYVKKHKDKFYPAG